MRRKKEWKQGLIIGALVLLAFWLGSLIWGLTDKVYIAVREAKETEAQYVELEERKEALQADLEVLATPRGQDAAIREAFGVAKEGEEIIVVVPKEPATTTPQKSWWERFIEWL